MKQAFRLRARPSSLRASSRNIQSEFHTAFQEETATSRGHKLTKCLGYYRACAEALRERTYDLQDPSVHHRALEADLLLRQRDGRARATSSRICRARLGGYEIGGWRGYPLHKETLYGVRRLTTCIRAPGCRRTRKLGKNYHHRSLRCRRRASPYRNSCILVPD